MTNTEDCIIFSDRLISDLDKAAEAVKRSKNALIITHIDADGITAGSIASITLDRLNIKHRILFEKKISEDTINIINNSSEDLVWICDLGSGYLSTFKRSNIVITDHHVPDPKWRKKQTRLDEFFEIFHLNPHVYGACGSYDVCGAGMTYLLSKQINPDNKDLAFLGILGALGDFQDNKDSKLIGYNKHILQDSIENEDVVPTIDLRFFGRETRPLIQFIQYSNDPTLPGLSDNQSRCAELFLKADIDLKLKGKKKVWNDLLPQEKTEIGNTLLELYADNEDVKNRMYGEVYSFIKYERDTGLRDGKEFATVLNSCGRYDDAETGLRICKGDLSALKDAEKNRVEHRRNISTALNYVKENHLIRERKFIQFFDAGSMIRETVVGIIAGMLLNSGDVRKELPILAFVEADDGVKVSSRTTHNMTNKGLDLSVVMKTAAEIVGGIGGGHSVAAGATIPKGTEEKFLDIVEDIVSSQII